MLSEPQFITRPEQPYAAIRIAVAQSEISQKAPPLIDEMAAWLQTHGVTQAGDAFFNYTKMGGSEVMEMEVGFPISGQASGDGRVMIGTLPAGRYATARYTGHYDGLRNAHEQLHIWLGKQGFAPENLGDARERSTLLEIYVTDPDEVADPEQWITDIAFKLPG